MPGASVLDRQRRRMFDDAREAHPRFHVGFDAFCSHLERVKHGDEEFQLDGRALYLCLACGLGDPNACRVLEVEYIRELRAHVARLHRARDFADEVLQQVRDRLLVGPRPRILVYRGRGELSSWLRRIARNVALDALRARCCRIEAESGERYARVSASAQCSPEEVALRHQLAHVAAGALTRALLTLGHEGQALLHSHFVHGLSIDVLGRTYAVDRSTAARRIVRHLEQLQRQVKQEIVTRCGPLGARELSQLALVLADSVPLDAERLLRGDKVTSPSTDEPGVARVLPFRASGGVSGRRDPRLDGEELQPARTGLHRSPTES